ncbi:MAG: hypothetical protein ABIQ09_03255 [Jatrophihabitantaceae bacterium]
MKKSARRAIFACAVVGFSVVAPVAPAQAAESFQVGTLVSGPDGACTKYMAANTHVKVCFAAYGEKLYVQDRAADGRSAIGELTFSTVGCRNKYGSGTWVRCDYNIPEGWHTTMIGSTRDFEGIINRTFDVTGEVGVVA